MKLSIVSALAALSLAVAAAPPAVAQSQPPSASPQRPAHVHHAFGLPSERVEARLAYMKTALKISDAQVPQWEAFANVVRKHAKQGDERVEARRARMEQAKAQGGERPRLTAIERLERRQQLLTAAAARLAELLTVQKPLYAALSPEQQQVADEVFAPRFHRGRHRGGRRGTA